MKLYHPAMAGQKLGTANGPLTVGADGWVETDDEEVAASLKISGFQSEEQFGDIKVTPKPRATEPVVQDATPQVEPEPEPEPEEFEEEQEAEDDDDGEEVEIEDLGDYNAKDAMAMVVAEEDIDVLNAWKNAEGDDKNRKTVLKALDDRIAEVS